MYMIRLKISTKDLPLLILNLIYFHGNLTIYTPPLSPFRPHPGVLSGFFYGYLDPLWEPQIRTIFYLNWPAFKRDCIRIKYNVNVVINLVAYLGESTWLH